MSVIPMQGRSVSWALYASPQKFRVGDGICFIHKCSTENSLAKSKTSWNLGRLKMFPSTQLLRMRIFRSNIELPLHDQQIFIREFDNLSFGHNRPFLPLVLSFSVRPACTCSCSQHIAFRADVVEVTLNLFYIYMHALILHLASFKTIAIRLNAAT